MPKNDNTKASVKMRQSENFKFTMYDAIPGEVLNEEDTYFDSRMYLLSAHTNFKTMDWFINYLETAAYFAARNRQAYPTYLLDLGYIPVVYLPTCVPDTLGVQLMQILDAKKIPYVKIKGTSFVLNYFGTDLVDAWVHKTDAAKVLGCAPEEVRAVPFVKEVFHIV